MPGRVWFRAGPSGACPSSLLSREPACLPGSKRGNRCDLSRYLRCRPWEDFVLPAAGPEHRESRSGHSATSCCRVARPATKAPGFPCIDPSGGGERAPRLRPSCYREPVAPRRGSQAVSPTSKIQAVFSLFTPIVKPYLRQFSFVVSFRSIRYPGSRDLIVEGTLIVVG